MRLHTGLAAAVIAAALSSGMQAAPARAQGWTCAASAVRITVAGQGTAEPARAGGDAAPCRPGRAELSSPALPLGQSAGALTARTATDAHVPAQADAAAQQVTLGMPAGLLPAPATGQIDAIAPVDVPVPLLGTVSADLRPALRALLRTPAGVDLLRLGSATATATARCIAGDAVVRGSSSIAGAILAGRPVDLTGPLQQTVELLGAYTIDPSDIDPAKVVQHGLTISPAALGPLLQPILDAMAPIVIPARVADVQLVPDERLQDGSRLTQRALHVRASVDGVELIDAVVAEASAGGDACSAGAGTTGASSVADLALQCASQRVVLVDVLEIGRRVKLVGAAAGRYVGRPVEIRLAATGAVVARPIVGEDGSFSATAPLPARRIRHTNAARYQASIDGERSLPLKLSRRMIVTRTTSTARGATMSGRVVGPHPRRAQVSVKRRAGCEEWKVVKRFTMPRDGHFRVTVPYGRGATSAVFRMQTSVGGARRPRPTFTLPRYVLQPRA